MNLLQISAIYQPLLPNLLKTPNSDNNLYVSCFPLPFWIITHGSLLTSVACLSLFGIFTETLSPTLKYAAVIFFVELYFCSIFCWLFSTFDFTISLIIFRLGHVTSRASLSTIWLGWWTLKFTDFLLFNFSLSSLSRALFPGDTETRYLVLLLPLNLLLLCHLYLQYWLTREILKYCETSLLFDQTQSRMVFLCASGHCCIHHN